MTVFAPHFTTEPPAVTTPPQSGRRQRTPASVVYFFLDFSNIAITAQQIAPRFGVSPLQCGSVRLSPENLRLLAERDRSWGLGYASAGLSDQQSPIKEQFERFGIEFDICERGRNSHTEQNVDEAIQLRMLHLCDPRVERGTVALATGDGNGFEANRGFIKALEILASQGFNIEVMSWRHSFSRHLYQWSTENGRAIVLDDFFPDLTFVEGVRKKSSKYQLSKKIARTGLIPSDLSN